MNRSPTEVGEMEYIFEKPEIDFSDEERESLLDLYTDSEFYDTSWVIRNNRSDMNLSKTSRTISFPNVHSDIPLRDFALYRLICGRAPATLRNEVHNIGLCLSCVDRPLEEFSKSDLFEIFKSISSRNIKTNSFVSIYNSFGLFLKEMSMNDMAAVWSGYQVPKYIPPKCSEKYISEYVSKQLDAIFSTDKIPLVFRCIYWTLRLFPCRIEEVVSIKVGAMKAINDSQFVLFIPTSKMAGPYDSPEIKSIYINNEGICAKYIEMIKEQQAYVETLGNQDTDFLFKYRPKVEFQRGDKPISYERSACTISIKTFSKWLSKFCKEYKVSEENGEPAHVTSHQFRHNATTDRLSSGHFHMVELVHLTGHHSTTMMSRSYAHNKPERKPVMFQGRIIDTDSERQMGIITSSPFSRTIHNLGICGDSSGCTKSTAHCLLRCEYFTPDSKYLPYYLRDLESWENKLKIAGLTGNKQYASLCQDWIDGYKRILTRVNLSAKEEYL